MDQISRTGRQKLSGSPRGPERGPASRACKAGALVATGDATTQSQNPTDHHDLRIVQETPAQAIAEGKSPEEIQAATQAEAQSDSKVQTPEEHPTFIRPGASTPSPETQRAAEAQLAPVGKFVQKPLANFEADPEFALPVKAAKALSQHVAKTHPYLAKALDAYAGTLEGEANLGTSMTTPENLGIMAGTEGFGELAGPAKAVVSRLISGGFAAQTLKSAYDQYPAVKKAIDSGDAEQAARAIAQYAGTVGMGVMAGTHAAGDIPAKAVEATKTAISTIPGEIRAGINAKAPVGSAEAGSVKIGKPPEEEPSKSSEFFYHAADKSRAQSIRERSEERRVGKECRRRWWRYK